MAQKGTACLEVRGGTADQIGVRHVVGQSVCHSSVSEASMRHAPSCAHVAMQQAVVARVLLWPVSMLLGMTRHGAHAAVPSTRYTVTRVRLVRARNLPAAASHLCGDGDADGVGAEDGLLGAVRGHELGRLRQHDADEALLGDEVHVVAA